MRKIFLISFLMIFTVSFSQKKIVKKREINADEINIYTQGLDNIVLENSNSGFLETYLYTENYNDQFVYIEEANNEANVKFDFEGSETREVIFRKFITKRLQRANAVIKIPKGKTIYIFGENVDIESKNINNELAIYIENGIVKLNEVKAKTTIKLYSGNVHAFINRISINANSNSGKIKIDDILYQKRFQSLKRLSTKKLAIETIKANIFITTKKTQ